MNTGNSRNLTGLYLSGFIQEGYLPPQERKSTIPSTLYRGHVVKLARRPNANPHRLNRQCTRSGRFANYANIAGGFHDECCDCGLEVQTYTCILKECPIWKPPCFLTENSVGRYPMHSLNSGFNGCLLPTKDQKNFRSPERPHNSSHKVHGKWTNYPMSVELRKAAGAGTSGRLLAEYILHRNQSVGDLHDQKLENIGRLSSSASIYQDKDEETFYQSMYDEIEKIVAKQSDCLTTNEHKLQNILINNPVNSRLPNVTMTSFPEVKRARTSHSYFGGKAPGSRRGLAPKRPNTTAPVVKDSTHSPLLLPLPYVSRYDLLARQPGHSNAMSSTSKQFNVSPNPFKSKLEGLLIQHKNTLRIDNLSRQYYPMNMKANIGMTSAERLGWFLGSSAQQSTPSSLEPSSAREPMVSVSANA